MNRLEISKRAFNQASKTIVGGVNSPVRSFRRVGGHPIFAKKAEGSFVWDLDGNKYIDFVLSYGPHLFGHAHPYLVDKIKEQLTKGFCFGLGTEEETLWAEKILKFFPNAEKVRAMSSGTEACMTAIRLARGHTKRELVLKFSGHYHGHVDWLMVDSGSGIATLSADAKPESAGLPSAVAQTVRVLPFNHEEGLKNLFEREGNQIACVILELVMGNMGVIPAKKEWLMLLETLCKKHGTLLIADEVMTGFRAEKLSAQASYELNPDLTCLGKVVGGGFPVSALIGKKDVMDCLAPLGSVYQAGTLSGNPVGIAAGRAMLELIEKENPCVHLNELGAWVENVFCESISRHKIAASVARSGSMISVFFRNQKPHDSLSAQDINHEQFACYFWAMIEEGLMIPPSPYEAYFLASTHEKDLKPCLEEKLDRVFRKVSQK